MLKQLKMLPVDILTLIRQFRGERYDWLKLQLTSHIDPFVLKYINHVNPVLLSDELCYIRPDKNNPKLDRIVALGTLVFKTKHTRQTLTQHFWTLRELILKISETELADRLENAFDFDQIFLSSAAITRNKKDLCEIDSLWTH